MFGHLTKHSKILVSGPQRSGTRICTKMIAHDTGYQCFEEQSRSTQCIPVAERLAGRATGVHNVFEVEELHRTKTNFVLQCPALSKLLHLFGDKDTAIVFMFRNENDILASQNRIGWTNSKSESEERNKYCSKKSISISKIKYDFWNGIQKENIIHSYEIEYCSLLLHPLWNDNRKNFKWNQTKSDDDTLKFI